MSLYLIALSKKAKIHIGDAKALYNGITAFAEMDLSGTISGREIKIGLCYGKIFQMEDPVNETNDVHLTLLGDFTADEISDVSHYISTLVEAAPGEGYKFLAGDVVRYNGGRQALDLLMQYEAKKRAH